MKANIYQIALAQERVETLRAAYASTQSEYETAKNDGSLEALGIKLVEILGALQAVKSFLETITPAPPPFDIATWLD